VKILLISLAGIGDTLLATPLIRELRRQFPAAQLDVFVLWKGSADLLDGNPHLNAVHQRNLLSGSRLKSLCFIRGLSTNNYDVSINTHPQARVHYRIVSALAGAKRRLSHSYECRGFADRWLVTDEIPQDYEEHSVEQNLRFLPLLGGERPSVGAGPELFLSSDEERFAEDFIAANGLADATRIGFHVGSGGTKNLPLKRWPLEHYEELIPQLLRRFPEGRVLLFGGPQERADHARLRTAFPNSRVVLVETASLKETATLLKRCHLFVSVDTALMHLAAAVRVPKQIVIEAPTLNKTNWPYGQKFVCVKNPIVAGRNLEYYRYDGRDIQGTREELIRCMKSITPAMVLAAIEKTLSS
jgi:ADP-heptose:LPS heptosyltransferase